MDKFPHYAPISVDLKRCEDQFFADLDLVHSLAEDTGALRMLVRGVLLWVLLLRVLAVVALRFG